MADPKIPYFQVNTLKIQYSTQTYPKQQILFDGKTHESWTRPYVARPSSMIILIL